MMLARSENSSQRFYSMSAEIRVERKAYYAILEATQKSELDVTGWLQWFLACLDRAFDGAEGTLASVLGKARFWNAYAQENLNERQRKVLNRWATLNPCDTKSVTLILSHSFGNFINSGSLQKVDWFRRLHA